MLNHLLTHNIYACDKCNFRSNSTNGLKSHKKKHNDKKFKCLKCEFKGASSTALNNHMKTHTEDQTFLSQPENETKNSQPPKRDREASVSPDKTDLDSNVRKNSIKKVKGSCPSM